jgi:putative DNA primase/helicase
MESIAELWRENTVIVLYDLRESFEQARTDRESWGRKHSSVYPLARLEDYRGAVPFRDFRRTDLGNSERFISRHGEDVLYWYAWGKWLIWTGARWERDEGGKVHRLGKATVRSMYQEAAEAEDEKERKALADHAKRSEAEARIKAMLELAKSEEPVSSEELDARPWFLNVQNGTIDLRTGELRPHRQEDLITKIAPVAYDPDARAPAWSAFLERVLPGEDLRAFVQRAVGYSATGDTSEQCMFINHGTGANGKSTFQEAISAALGEYAMRAPTEMLLAKRAGGIPNDVARLKGARFVAASETEEGRRLAESLIKDLTGQDTITARFMRAEWFDFQPTHKLWLSTNHKPEIRGTDTAIWRRIRLVPWTVTIPPAEQDKRLAATLRHELPGILAWIVRGCLEWQREGLWPPDEVKRATGRYRAEMDVLAAFIDEECIVGEYAGATAKALYSAYKDWCEENGERPESQRRFGGRLKERGFESGRMTTGARKGAVEWYGIGLAGGPEGSPGAGRFTGRKSSKEATNDENPNGGGEQSEPEITMNAYDSEPRGDMAEKGSLHSLGSPGGISEPLTDEEVARIKELRRQGMNPAVARDEVLRKRPGSNGGAA